MMRQTLKMMMCLILGLSWLPACSPSEKIADTPPTLRFSAIPDQNTSELEAKFRPIATYLSDTLDIPVEYVPSQNYAASVEMFKQGDIQLAWFGGLTGVQARQLVPGATAIAQGAADPNYLSYFIAHKDTGLNPSDEFPVGLSELPFAFGSPQSTSGRLMPTHFILQETGQSPEVFFKTQPVFSGSHDKTLELVSSGGAIKAGVLNYKVFDRQLAETPELGETVQVIWVTPPYADYNFTAHPDLEARYGEGFTSRLQQALLDLSDPALLSAFPRDRMIPATNEDYDGIEIIARDLGFVE